MRVQHFAADEGTRLRPHAVEVITRAVPSDDESLLETVKSTPFSPCGNCE